MNVDDTSRLWNDIFHHMSFKYMQQLNKDAILENIPRRILRKGRLGGPPLLWSSSKMI
jgi:hypothetical protein